MLSQRVRIRCEPDKKQVSKWTAEGAVKRVTQPDYSSKGLPGVFCNVMMCVNHQGYDSILLSARLCRESRWYRG